jgi:hypothetical protein
MPSQIDRRGSVVADELAATDVAAHHRDRAVARLIHDRTLAGAGGRRRGCQPGTQAVAGDMHRIQSDCLGATLDHQGYGPIAEPAEQGPWWLVARNTAPD